MIAKISSLSLILVLPFSFGCQRDQVRTENSASRQEAPKDGNYNGKGKVTKIDTRIGSVELEHQAIEGLMAAMRMEFYVSDKSMLTGLNNGDEVDFVVEYKQGTEKIVQIHKVK